MPVLDVNDRALATPVIQVKGLPAYRVCGTRTSYYRLVRSSSSRPANCQVPLTSSTSELHVELHLGSHDRVARGLVV